MIDVGRLEPIDFKLAQLHNLCAALEVVSTDVASISLPERWDRVQRDGLLGVIDATLAKVKDLSEEIDALRNELTRMAA